MPKYSCVAESNEDADVDVTMTFEVTAKNIVDAAVVAQEKVDGLDDEANLFSIVECAGDSE